MSIIIEGLAHPLDVNDATTREAFIDTTSARLIAALPQPEPDPKPTNQRSRAEASSALSGTTGISAFSDSQRAAFSMLQDAASKANWAPMTP